jgi:Tol biopolymer transport system component
MHKTASLLAIIAAMLALSGCYTGVSFSPDSKRLLAAGKHGWYIMNVDGSAAKALPESDEAERPSWSPDGRWLAFEKSPIAFNLRPVRNTFGRTTHDIR